MTRVRMSSENDCLSHHRSSIVQNNLADSEDVLARYFDFGSDLKRPRPMKGQDLRSKLSFPGKQDIAKKILNALQVDVNKKLQDEGIDTKNSCSILSLTK